MNSLTPGTRRFAWWVPDETQIRARMDRVQEEGSKAPRRSPGDRFILAGAAVGVIIGIYFGSKTNTIGLLVIAVIGGGIAGAIVGTAISNRINRNKELEDFRHKNLKGKQ